MKNKIHLVSANSKNIYGMEYFVTKAFKTIGWDVIETDYRVMSKELVDIRIKYITDCDFLLAIKAERVNPESIFACRIPTILWMQDSVEANQEANFVIKTKSSLFDIVYSFNDAELSFYKQFNSNSHWLPLACDPDIHQSIENNNKLIDVGFVGNLNNNRVNMIRFLLDKGVPVQYNQSMNKYSEIINDTKINLNIGITSTGIQQRVFEILSMGGFLLTNKIQSNELLQDKKHLIYYNDFDNLVGLVYNYINRLDEMKKIACAGMKEVLEKHTYVNRVKAIIDQIKGA